MIFRLLVDIADCLPLFEKGEQVDRQYLLVGKLRLVVVALPLDGSREATPAVSANEQVDSNERILGVHVAKGGLSERCWSIFFQAACGDMVFQPLIGICSRLFPQILHQVGKAHFFGPVGHNF